MPIIIDRFLDGNYILKNIYHKIPNNKPILLTHNLLEIIPILSSSQKEELNHFFITIQSKHQLTTPIITNLEYNLQINSFELLQNLFQFTLPQSRFGQIGLLLNQTNMEFINQIQKQFQEIIQTNQIQYKNKPKLTIITSPLLYPLIENNWLKKPETKMILKKNIMPLKHAHIDTLILTNPLFDQLQQQFTKKMGKNCQIISYQSFLTQYLTKTITTSQLPKSQLPQIITNHFTPEQQAFTHHFFGSKIPFFTL